MWGKKLVFQMSHVIVTLRVLSAKMKSCSYFLTDQFEKVKKYYQESVKAEEKCNSTVSGPLSPVEQSKETRVLTEDLLDASKDKLLRTLAAQNKSLSELQQKADDLDKEVHHLSHKVDSFHSCVTVYLNKQQ